jgi:pilus assembly protein Flp/PilA
MMRLLVRFLSDDRGATAIEYALIGGLISIAIILGASALGSKLNVIYSGLAASVPDGST